MNFINLLQIHFVFSLLYLYSLFVITISANDVQTDVTTSATTTINLRRSISDSYNSEDEGLTKNNIKISDLSSSNTIPVGKSYEPPPEFYRGPGSTGHFTPTVVTPYYSNYKPSNGFISKPIAFPDTYNYNKYNTAGSASGVYDNSDKYLANGYNSWQHLNGKVGALLNRKGTLQDRIHVGYYGTSEHDSSTGIGNYAYDSRPYGGHTHHVEHIPVHSQYDGNAATYAHSGGYYGSTAVAEGIPFNVYGSKNHHYSGYVGSDPYSEVHESAAHKTPPNVSQKILLAKSFLIPLASATVLGLAAALVSNPLLLQLGTVSGGVPGAVIFGKRKRRALTKTLAATNSSKNNLNVNITSRRTNKDETVFLPYRAHHYNRH